MIKLVGFLFLFSFSATALVPVEGILLGEAEESIQTDPLKSIFSGAYDTSSEKENNKVKIYLSRYLSGEGLRDSCQQLGPPVYVSSWQEKQAKRAVSATLQYIGLDATVKAIGAYGKKLEMSEKEFTTLASNLVKNYCSKNVTVMALKTIEKSLLHYYKTPDTSIIPSVKTSPFAPETLRTNSETLSSRSKEFDVVIKSFRSFCSWGGQSEDYRLLTNYLKNPYIMAFVIKNLMGLQDVIKDNRVTQVPSRGAVQVVCTDLVCRKENEQIFLRRFPFTVGSTGVGTDAAKLYCHHFRFQDSSKTAVPEIKEWIKSSELEDPIIETSQFIALMTGVPDFFHTAQTYRDLPVIAKSSIDELWNQWAKKMLASFSHDLLYEEPLKIKLVPKTPLELKTARGFAFNFSITMGELDRVLNENDKLGLSFDLKLSKNYLRMIRTKWTELQKEVDLEGQKQFKEEISQYLAIQIKEKQKLFKQKFWNEDFPRILADELIHQSIAYEGKMFHSYQDEILEVPVVFNYGLFALGYLHYRGDVNAGRLKLNL